ncbi:MAG: hypothetical protein KDC35_20825 [Acidobacteria bacterium]|nr:hypothetical protein [Acidobacteriota bacterium]
MPNRPLISKIIAFVFLLLFLAIGTLATRAIQDDFFLSSGSEILDHHFRFGQGCGFGFLLCFGVSTGWLIFKGIGKRGWMVLVSVGSFAYFILSLRTVTTSYRSFILHEQISGIRIQQLEFG